MMKQGLGLEARALVESHVGLVRACARRTHAIYLDFDDRCQIGMLGLMNAAKAFDPARGAFPPYAWVAIRRAIRAEDRKAAVAAGRLCELPTETLVSQYSEQSSHGCDRTTEVRELIARFTGGLNATQLAVLAARFGFDGVERSLHDIARDLDVSHETVRRIQSAAIEAIKRRLEDTPDEEEEPCRNVG